MTAMQQGPANPPRCRVCDGLLTLSAYGGYVHDDDARDDHAPVLAPGRHRAAS